MQALLLFFAVLISFSNLSLAKSTNQLSGFSIDLIHRDSLLSPFYNSSITTLELFTKAALRSLSRTYRVSLSVDDNDLAESIIVPNGGDYLTRIYIGTPPVETLAIADTGSDLIWVQCSPCQLCYPQNAPIFDPKSSSTFKGVSCDSNPCTLLPRGGSACGASGKCLYRYGYGDNSYTIGELAVDSINFDSNNGGQAVSFPKSVFGCGHINNGTFQPTGAGLVGLGGGPLSLVSQLGDQIDHKFSYCLLPYSATSPSKLKFGSEAVISGNGVVSTPLYSKIPTAYYYLNLEGITVAQKRVATGESGGNIVIDSGTTLTLFERSLYNNFAELVKEAMGVEAEQNPPNPFNLCYKYGSDTKFPEFVFHFTGADLAMQTGNLFVGLSNDLACLGVFPTDRTAILGNVAQINFQVEYDVKGKTVSFAPTDCTKQ